MIREYCQVGIEGDAEQNQVNATFNKYIDSLEQQVIMCQEQIKNKDQLIESLKTGQLIVNKGFRPIRWIWGLLVE